MNICILDVYKLLRITVLDVLLTVKNFDFLDAGFNDGFETVKNSGS